MQVSESNHLYIAIMSSMRVASLYPLRMKDLKQIPNVESATFQSGKNSVPKERRNTEQFECV